MEDGSGNRAVLDVLSLRQRLSELLSPRGLLARFPFRRLPALRALLVFLDTLPLDGADALAFAAPLPPAVVGGVALPLTERDCGISIPAALLQLHLAVEGWRPEEELEARCAAENAAAALQSAAASGATATAAVAGAAGGYNNISSGTAAAPANPQPLTSSSSMMMMQPTGSWMPVNADPAALSLPNSPDNAALLRRRAAAAADGSSSGGEPAADAQKTAAGVDSTSPSPKKAAGSSNTNGANASSVQLGSIITPNPAVAVASPLFHPAAHLPAQQLPFTLFAGAVTAVEVELAWRVLQGACVLSPSQQAQAADERVLEAAMTHIRHALSISPVVERELLRAQAVPTGATAHQLGLLRVALAALPAVEVVLRRSVAALRLALSSGFITFLFANVLGNANCCKCIRTAGLDLISTTLWDCHYCVPRGVAHILGGNSSHGGAASPTTGNAASGFRPGSRPASARAQAGEYLQSSPEMMMMIQQQQQQQSPSSTSPNYGGGGGGGAGFNAGNAINSQLHALCNAALASDLEIASAVASLITVVRAELVLLEKHNSAQDKDGGKPGVFGSMQTTDDVLAALIHLRDPSGISYWSTASSNQQQPPSLVSGGDPQQQPQAVSSPNFSEPAAAGAGGGGRGATPRDLAGAAATSTTATAGGPAADDAADTAASSAVPPPPVLPGGAMPPLRLGGLGFLNAITASSSSRAEAGAFERQLAAAASLSRRTGAGGSDLVAAGIVSGNAAGSVPMVPLSLLRNSNNPMMGAGGGSGAVPSAVPDSARRTAPLHSSRQQAGTYDPTGSSNASPTLQPGLGGAAGAAAPSGLSVFARQQQQLTARQQHAQMLLMQQQQQQQQALAQQQGEFFSVVSNGAGASQMQLRRNDNFNRAAASMVMSMAAGGGGAANTVAAGAAAGGAGLVRSAPVPGGSGRAVATSNGMSSARVAAAAAGSHGGAGNMTTEEARAHSVDMLLSALQKN